MEKYLGQNLFFLRKQAGLKQSEIYDRLGIRATTWSMYEIDKAQPPLDVLMKISNYFEVSENLLLRVDLRANAHLIEKNKSEEKQENAHLIAHGIAHPIVPKEEKSKDSPANEIEFNSSLNDDKTTFKALLNELHKLSSKVAKTEANMSKRITQIEDKIKSLDNKHPKM